jgi:hypothetical protein
VWTEICNWPHDKQEEFLHRHPTVDGQRLVSKWSHHQQADFLRERPAIEGVPFARLWHLAMQYVYYAERPPEYAAKADEVITQTRATIFERGVLMVDAAQVQFATGYVPHDAVDTIHASIGLSVYTHFHGSHSVDCTLFARIMDTVHARCLTVRDMTIE